MRKPKTAMVVADSAELRTKLRERVYREGKLEVIASSSHGELALHRLARSNPDVIVVSAGLAGDVLAAVADELRRIKPTLLFMMYDPDAPVDSGRFESTTDVIGRQNTLQSVRAFGAREGTERSTPAQIPGGQDAAELPGRAHDFQRRRSTMVAGGEIEAVVIGVSTGGPPALREVLPRLPADFPPVFLVQHVMAEFVTQLASRLDRECTLDVFEATEGSGVHRSGCWVAPGDQHMRLKREGDRIEVVLDRGPRVQSSRPSVDVLFESAASVYGDGLLAVVMTGMGRDGLDGCRAVRQAGGHVMVQDRESSAVWGMPGAVAEAGLAHEIVPLDTLGWTISQRVRSSRGRNTVQTLRNGGDA